MYAVWLYAVILLLSWPAAAQTYLGVPTVPANSGPGASCCSVVKQLDASNASVPADGTCPGCSVITQAQYNAFQAAVTKPATTQNSADSQISAGITLTCSVNPALSGTYAVNITTMSFLNTIIGYYVANGNTLPAAAQNLTVLDKAGNLHSFTSVADLQNFYKAVGGYWLAVLNWKQRVIAGQSPAAPANTSSAC